MDNQPEALRHDQLADLFEIEPDKESLYRQAAAELRRLHAENERLRIEAQNSKEAWNALTDHAEKVRAENERLRADTARYKWVKSRALWRPNGANCVTWDVQMPEPDIRAGVLTESSVGDELDAAIDAAIKEQQ